MLHKFVNFRDKGVMAYVTWPAFNFAPLYLQNGWRYKLPICCVNWRQGVLSQNLLNQVKWETARVTWPIYKFWDPLYLRNGWRYKFQNWCVDWWRGSLSKKLQN